MATNAVAPQFVLGSGPYADQWKVIMAWFGSPDNVPYGMDLSTRPVTSITIQDYYGQKSTYAGQMMQTNLVNMSGWHFDVSTMQKQQGITEEWDKITYHNLAMKPAPPEAVPEFLTSSSESFKFTLTKYHGALEENTEFLLTPPGQQHFAAQQAQAISSMNITLKLILTMAIINTPSPWNEVIVKTKYFSVRDALSPDVDMIFIANKDPDAIYKMNKYVREFTSQYNTNYDALVTTFGTMNNLAYGGKETDPQRISADVAYSRLKNGGDSLKGALPGLQVYEDTIWNVQNLPTRDLQLLRRRMLAGEFVMVDGSDYGAVNSSDDYNCNRDSTIMNLDAVNDVLSPISLSDCITNDVAWVNNEPNPKFGDFIRNIQSELTKTGMTVLNNQYDPWIISSNRIIVDGQRPSANGLSVISVWGNQSEAYRSFEHDRQFGARVAEKIKKNLGAKKIESLQEGKKLSKRLLDITDVKVESVQGYFAAIAANPDNWLGSPYESTGSIYLKGNNHSTVELPYVDRDPASTNTFNEPMVENVKNPDGSLATTAEGYPILQTRFEMNRSQALNYKGDGALYILVKGVRYYCWVLEYDDRSALDLDIKTMRNFVEVQGPALNNLTTSALVGDLVDVTDFHNFTGPFLPAVSTGVFGVNIPFRSKIKGFVFAPFNFFGTVSEDGQANRWIERTVLNGAKTDGQDIQPTPNTPFLSNEGIFLWSLRHLQDKKIVGAKAVEIEPRTQRIIEQMKILLGTSRRGIKAPRLVRAPLVPWGTGYMHSLRGLADMYKNGSRGWDRDMCKSAFDYVEDYNSYADANAEMSPECIILNGVYTPEFMYTGNREEDIRNNIHFNFIEQASYPIWTRVPVSTQVFQDGTKMVSLPTLLFYDETVVNGSITTPKRSGNLVSTFTEADVANILQDMGAIIPDNIIERDGSVRNKELYGKIVESLEFTDGMKSKKVITTNALGSVALKLSNVLNHRNLDPNIKNILKNNKGPLSTAYSLLMNNYSTERSGLGSSYMRMKMSEGTDASMLNTSFLVVFINEIAPMIDEIPDNTNADKVENVKRSVRLFNGILNLAVSAMRSQDGFRNDITRTLLVALSQYVSRDAKDLLNKDYETVEDSRNQFIAANIGAAADNQQNAIGSIGWINTRLFLNKMVWEMMHKQLVEGNPTQEDLLEYYNINIRPSNPANPVEPLGADLITLRNAAVTVDNLKSQFQQFKAARAGEKRDHPWIENTVVGNYPMFAKARTAPRSVGPNQRNSNRDTRLRVGQRDPYSAITPDRPIVYSRISDDPTGPFNVLEEYTDREGNPLPPQTRFVREENLHNRLYNAFHTIADPFERVATLMMLLTRVTQSSELNWLRKGVPVPDSSYICARIACMLSDAAFFIEKKRTARIGYNFINTTIGYDNIKDKLVLKYAGYFGAHVMDPTKLYIVNDFRAAGIVCGLDNTFYKSADDFDPLALNKQKRGSFLAFRCGSRWNLASAQSLNPISLFGKYSKDMQVQDIQDPQSRIFATLQQFPSFHFYNYLFGLTSMRPPIPLNRLNTYASLRANPSFNGLVWLRKFYKYNNKTGKYDIAVSGTSFLGNADPPIRSILNGGTGVFTNNSQ